MIPPLLLFIDAVVAIGCLALLVYVVRADRTFDRTQDLGNRRLATKRFSARQKVGDVLRRLFGLAPRHLSVRDVVYEREMLLADASAYRQLDDDESMYVSSILEWDANLLAEAMKGEMKANLDPRIASTLSFFHRGFSYHFDHGQKVRAHDALSHLTLSIAQGTLAPTRAGKPFYRLLFGLHRPTVDELERETNEFRKLRVSFTDEAAHFMDDALRSYSPARTTEFVAKWRALAITRGDAHLLMLLTSIGANQRHLAALSRQGHSDNAKRIKDLLHKWALAMVRGQLKSEYRMAINLTKEFASMDFRRIRRPAEPNPEL